MGQASSVLRCIYASILWHMDIQVFFLIDCLESCEMHSEDDKALLEKNKKRIVKTRAQVEALEKFYNEHKYPTEAMKQQVAESIGLTEKQVSGWFCHRRLKDKKVINEEKHATGVIRQDRSSGVIQDRGSGLRQDSCGSTKQGDDLNLDMREVESERLTAKEFSNADLTYEHGSHHAGNYNHVDRLSSGSSSSMSNHQERVPLDAVTSRYQVPKFHTGAEHEKARHGPAGYLKVKGRAENGAITAVKRQLGKHYREDGPPLGVEFDALPPGAFESATGEPDEENYYDGEDVLPASTDVSEMQQNPNISKGREFKPSMAFENPNVGRAYDIHDTHTHHKFRQPPSMSTDGIYYPRSTSVIETRRSESMNEYGVRVGSRVEVMRSDSFTGNSNLQPSGGKVRKERMESQFCKYSDVGPKVSIRETMENEFSNMTEKGNEYYGSGERGMPRQIVKVRLGIDAKVALKDGKMMYSNRRMIDENPVTVPFKNDLAAPKRMREEFPQQQYQKRSSFVDDQPHKYQVVRSRTEMPTSFSEDEESVETSSSVD
ncbi:homeodomain-like superfamily protein [Striga asiatica]|uniref:Homeodomain-like superfamily protein n=1 Tax=Striga asiatica TaxID=4170 RepID=A0A5A7QTE8_STRAF|nr:homeodomain-like superfamily protein [Striga asiatica]